MNSDMKKLTPLSLLLIIGLGCIAPDWEDVSSDYESELNVFAFISLDETIPPFVQVRQTLGLEGSVEFIGYDTLYNEDSSDYYIYEVTESRYAVEDADVTISDGVTEYELTLFDEDSLYEIEGWWRFNNFWSGGVYIDSFGLFVPEPNKDYFLTVTASDGRELTGEVTTPPIPEIKLESVPDSIDANTSYTIKFKPMVSFFVLILIYSLVFLGGLLAVDACSALVIALINSSFDWVEFNAEFVTLIYSEFIASIETISSRVRLLNLASLFDPSELSQK